MYVLEFHEALFDEPHQVVTRSPLHGWRIFAECSSDDPDSCIVNDLTSEWEDRDASDYVALMLSLCRKAAQGMPLEKLFDRTKLHDVGDIEIDRAGRGVTKLKLWQLRKESIRFLFFYGEGNRIIIAAHAFIKHGKKVPPAAILAGKKAAQNYFNELDNSSIYTVTDQGKSHEFSEAHKKPR